MLIFRCFNVLFIHFLFNSKEAGQIGKECTNTITVTKLLDNFKGMVCPTGHGIVYQKIVVYLPSALTKRDVHGVYNDRWPHNVPPAQNYKGGTNLQMPENSVSDENFLNM